MSLQLYREQVDNNGFTVIPAVYTVGEIDAISKSIALAGHVSPNFRKTDDLFAIRQLFKEVPGLLPLVFNGRLKALINNLFGPEYFLIKSIYFDKPGNSNWFVAYHQDLTISVDKKADIEGFSSWTIKSDQFAVQPPVTILNDNFTIRIHLDDTNADNGALKVIPGIHKKGIYRPDQIDLTVDKETICNVPAGGVMIMKPLLMHASNRTLNNKNRRVIHLELSKAELPDEIKWAERLVL
ncbi:phytanoyl-CoA dioxygenase [Mucilaginibacter limnophilus]|uniref:Phytanoyl-CoA dioxygenase n=1 Tax=Mucilaginibacter limnophilus TaxID=1932778 RepID=A0A437MYC3_9SPHI|nr:phytanoyl-CoA dioxygenase family protein [Mucilaginibacter limnophilus]RVU02658.1 phytanoyl-CoA dioxygenase [Mucilaginibacter limnophilus]